MSSILWYDLGDAAHSGIYLGKKKIMHLKESFNTLEFPPLFFLFQSPPLLPSTPLLFPSKRASYALGLLLRLFGAPL